MKSLIRLLKTSLWMLALVAIIYAGLQYLSENQPGYVVQSISKLQSQSESIVNSIGDILQTVSSTTSQETSTASDSLKVDFQPAEGVGALVTDSTTSTTSSSGAAQTYDFPENMYPYRAMLTENQKKVYDQIYENCNELNTDVTLCVQLDTAGIQNVMTAIFQDHPELFWLETSYTYGYTNKGTVISVSLTYNDTIQNFESSQSAFLNAAATIINNASSYTTDLEKEKYVYKALENLCTYDENSDLNQSAYSALVNGSSVCAGYARAFQYIMMQLNIPCYFCSGYANGGNHAWNIVYVDGKYYNVDLSWDDNIGEYNNTISYAYFNISDTAISVDHTRKDMSVNLPKCN